MHELGDCITVGTTRGVSAMHAANPFERVAAILGLEGAQSNADNLLFLCVENTSTPPPTLPEGCPSRKGHESGCNLGHAAQSPQPLSLTELSLHLGPLDSLGWVQTVQLVEGLGDGVGQTSQL